MATVAKAQYVICGEYLTGHINRLTVQVEHKKGNSCINIITTDCEMFDEPIYPIFKLFELASIVKKKTHSFKGVMNF